MILRRFARALRDQKWSEIVIELLIVIFGVYVGIYLGDIQAAREQVIETDQALAALESELRSDLARLDEVIAIQTIRIHEQEELVRLWGGNEVDGERIAPLLQSVLNDNSTFFPNRAAYSAMKAAGFLAALPDETLRLNLTRLFEREYARQDLNANLYDEIHFDFANMILAPNWDRVNKKLMGERAIALANLRNGMITVRDQGKFYFAFITGQIRPDIVTILDMIDAYQEGRNK